MVEIRVVDDGIGIAPEDRDKVFERFFRLPVAFVEQDQALAEASVVRSTGEAAE